MSDWPLHPLRPLSYRVIYADPAWLFENWSKAGEWKNAARHYDCMPTEEIAALPVGHLAQRDCVLFLWATCPMLEDAMLVMRAWGFQYKTLIAWGKRSRSGRAWQFGPGYIVRGTVELLLIGTMGEPSRRDTRAARSVRNILDDPVHREHSRKPDSAMEAIETLYDGPYVELFARRARKGWDRWGKEAPATEAA